jgi:hypothetical protein
MQPMSAEVKAGVLKDSYSHNVHRWQHDRANCPVEHLGSSWTQGPWISIGYYLLFKL